MGYRLTAADYSSAEFFHYRYDRVGNRLTQDTPAGTNVYTYDDANRLAGVSQGTDTYAFAYSGLADRLQQTIDGVPTKLYPRPQPRAHAGPGGRHEHMAQFGAISRACLTPWAAGSSRTRRGNSGVLRAGLVKSAGPCLGRQPTPCPDEQLIRAIETVLHTWSRERNSDPGVTI